MQSTKCWECAKATGFCSWSQEFKPIKNWNAVKTKHVNNNGVPLETYLIIDCPEFVRDSTNIGLERLEKKTK